MASVLGFHELPQELVLCILAYAIHETPYRENIPFLFLSKDIYSWILPKFYHSIQFDTQKYNPYDVDSKKLLASANPASLLHVRKLKAGNRYDSDAKETFAVFSNLTHLLLWGAHGFDSPSAQAVLNLPLEEFIVWTPTERSELLTLLSTECTVARTLRRFGSYGVWTEDDFHGLNCCRNLSNILFYCGSLSPTVFPIFHVGKILEKESFSCCRVVPGFTSTKEELLLKIMQIFYPLHDRRVVVAKAVKATFGRNCSSLQFWDAQTVLWNAAEVAVALHSQVDEITVVDQLP